MSWPAWAEAQLGDLAERRLLRSLRSLTPLPSANGLSAALVGNTTYQQMLDNTPSTGEVEAVAGGMRLTIFAANDYLGLSAHPEVRQAAAAAALAHGSGPRGSALVCGYTHAHRELETALAAPLIACGARVVSRGGELGRWMRGSDAPAATAVSRRWRLPPLQVHSYTKP